MMQVRNSYNCQYDFEDCDKKPIGVVNGKWSCGRCMVKLEQKIKELNQKQFEKAVLEIKEENKQC